ncbi:hypothetical protein SK128_019683 [Halocaridina rubra]|uniref:NACHT domain-containing protein n=1 Tax=Halocaridina rubra TaxID=373956 RepID=A0AAN9AGW4_HALRR
MASANLRTSSTNLTAACQSRNSNENDIQIQNPDQFSMQIENTTTNSIPTPDTSQSNCQTRDSSSSTEDNIVPVQASIFSNPNPGTSRNIPTNVSSEDENVLKYFIMLRPTGPVATVLAKVCMVLYPGGADSVKDYCLNTLGLSNADYRKLFTSLEIQKLDAKIGWDTLDITFLYKLLQRVCGLASPSDKKWANPALQDTDTIEHSLYLIKVERNFLAHEAVVLSNLALEERAQHLKKLLMNVLQGTSVRTHEDYSQDIVTLNSKIDEILSTTSRLSLHVYQKELEKLRSEIVNKVIRESKQELCEYYADLWSSTMIGWSQNYILQSDEEISVPNIEHVFTNITIKDKNGDKVNLCDMFNHRFSDGPLPRLLIIEGIAGIGKSFLCRYIVHEWVLQDSSAEWLLDVEILIFIQCHSMNSDSLREFLCEELLPKTCSCLRHEDIIPALRKCNVIFIVDGVDEAGPRAKIILKEINTKFPSSRILATCRPEFTDVAKTLLTKKENLVVFYAKGFTESQRSEYLRKVLSALQKIDVCDLPETLNDKIKELDQHLVSLLSLPLTVMMVILLYLEDSESLSRSTTVTHIYKKTIDMRLKQVAERIQRKPMESRHINLIEHLCKKWFEILCEVAWETLMLNTQILDEKCTLVLMDKAMENNIDPIDVMSSFLKCKMFGNKYVWEFFHKAFQEYLSASYVSSSNKDIFEELYKPFEAVGNTTFQMERVPKYLPSRRLSLSRILNYLKSICCCKAFSRRERTRAAHYSRRVCGMPIKRGMPVNLPLYYDVSGTGSRAMKNSQNVEHFLCSYSFSMDSIGTEWSSSTERSRDKAVIELNSIVSPHVESCMDDESPYEMQDDLSEKTVALQNTLLFLGAMEVSKIDMDESKMKDITKRFSKSIIIDKWLKWATFIRECAENPIVCQLVQQYLNGNDIESWIKNQKAYEHLEDVEYLLKKTRFEPKKIELWFLEENLFPKNLQSLLSTIRELLPLLTSNVETIPRHSKALQYALDILDTLDFINLCIKGNVKQEHMEDFVSLMKFLNDRDAEVKLEILIDDKHDLAALLHCCINGRLPRRVYLQLIVSYISDDMQDALCQILRTFSWFKPFSFVFTHTQLSEETAKIQDLLTKTMKDVLVHLKEVELIVDAYAESMLDAYEKMADHIAGDIPVALTFNDWADSDNVCLIFKGDKKTT